MNNSPLLQPESQPWGYSISQLIDETSAAIPGLEADLSARFKGINSVSSSLGTQPGELTSGLDQVQPTRAGFASAAGFTLPLDDNTWYTLTATLPVPSGYSGAMVQAQGSAYGVDTNNLTHVDMMGQVGVNGSWGPQAISAVQVVGGNQWHYDLRNFYNTIASVSATLTVQMRLAHRGYRAITDTRNAAQLAVMATFFKGTVPKPPA